MFDIKKRKLRYSDFPIIELLSEKKDRTLWKAKSYNQDKQIEEFIKHTYFAYEAPVWAIYYVKNVIEKYLKYDLDAKLDLSKEHKIKELKKEYHKKTIYDLYFFDIFESVQEGKGFYDLLKPFMTKKEIYYFIFKSTSTEIEQGRIEGKLLNINADIKIINWVINRFNRMEDSVYSFFEYCVRKEVGINEIQELYDYFYAIKRTRTEVRIDDKYILIKDFLKRDINTIRQASNEWHIDQTKLKKSEIAVWEKKYETFEEIRGETIYQFVELNTTRQLINEGRTMKHCVGSYASRCISGGTRIISIKKDEASYITVELNRNSIVQAQLKFNQKINNFEYFLISKFADKHNLRVAI
jgi:hypothetical protein